MKEPKISINFLAPPDPSQTIQGLFFFFFFFLDYKPLFVGFLHLEKIMYTIKITRTNTTQLGI